VPDGVTPPTGGLPASRRHLAAMGMLASAGSTSHQIQEKAGAPGWNRSSDTRFRKHAAGVTGGGLRYAIVPHGPQSQANQMTGRARACSPVTTHSVGIAAAMGASRQLASSGRRDAGAERTGFVRTASAAVRRGYAVIMLDLLLIVLIIGFFVVADLFVRGCGRLVDRSLDDRQKDRR
jgi:hypothetical protein